MTETLLIVDPDTDSQRAMVELLRAGRYQTLAADSFQRAVHLLESVRPDLLITVVRLGVFNGLHLIVLGRASNPRMAALALDERRDAVLEQEARDAGAIACLRKPCDSHELLRRIAEALASRERRFWSRTSVSGLLVVRTSNRRVRLLDISYGGFRVESGTVHNQGVLRLELPIHGLSVNAQHVWSCRTDAAGVWACGAALLAPIDWDGTRRWRRLVDMLRKEKNSLS